MQLNFGHFTPDIGTNRAWCTWRENLRLDGRLLALSPGVIESSTECMFELTVLFTRVGGSNGARPNGAIYARASRV